ncbi:hypothetical protein BDN72DRAFT_381383 [Pluteus cervinus]|uniref:Uncharacterized protein n=1 Tax=Pluteus cervinus TaxID=181527 RepID=A0ACD3B3F1_9AGAR|nr:hypothetical protein BDN72DRAFT_381383 [Pluteus cervinus]
MTPSILLDSSNTLLVFEGSWDDPIQDPQMVGGYYRQPSSSVDPNVFINSKPAMGTSFDASRMDIYGSAPAGSSFNVSLGSGDYNPTVMSGPGNNGAKSALITSVQIPVGIGSAQIVVNSGSPTVDYLVFVPRSTASLSSKTVLVDDRDPYFKFKGSWTQSDGPTTDYGPAYNNTRTGSNTKGDSATIIFSASSISVYGLLNPTEGILSASFSLDGGKATTFNPYNGTQTVNASGWLVNQQFFSIGAPTTGVHSLTINVDEVTGSQMLWIDYITLGGTTLTTLDPPTGTPSPSSSPSGTPNANTKSTNLSFLPGTIVGIVILVIVLIIVVRCTSCLRVARRTAALKALREGESYPLRFLPLAFSDPILGPRIQQYPIPPRPAPAPPPPMTGYQHNLQQSASQSHINYDFSPPPVHLQQPSNVSSHSLSSFSPPTSPPPPGIGLPQYGGGFSPHIEQQQPLLYSPPSPIPSSHSIRMHNTIPSSSSVPNPSSGPSSNLSSTFGTNAMGLPPVQSSVAGLSFEAAYGISATPAGGRPHDLQPGLEDWDDKVDSRDSNPHSDRKGGSSSKTPQPLQSQSPFSMPTFVPASASTSTSGVASGSGSNTEPRPVPNQRLERLEQEIERLRLENQIIRDGGGAGAGAQAGSSGEVGGAGPSSVGHDDTPPPYQIM